MTDKAFLRDIILYIGCF